jgi:two-component system, NtrC family, nitrogen regulation sensor histidine kinase NtrY
MAYETRPPRRVRQAVRRAWIYAMLLSLPAIIFLGIFLFQRQLDLVPALLLALCLLIYLALLTSALIEGFVRPLQTLSNVVSSLREGDYSFRARGAASGDALGELSAEINALADLLQKQRVRSLEATALLARILEVMQAPLFAFDRGNRLRLVNSAGLRLLGRPYARCLEHSADELGLNEMLSAPDESIRTLGANPARWLLHKAAFRQDGAPHTLLVLADVSVPLQEEEQAAWRRLIRVLGHELSNSLTPIKSIAGSLLARVENLSGDDAEQNDFRRGLGVIESRADALHRFVQSYRMLAQLPPPALRPISLGPLMERVTLLEQRIPVELDAGPTFMLSADPDQLEQMLINLLANAVDASLVNGSHPVRVTWSLASSSVQIVIEDRGLGIANPENLFVPFYTTKAAGSGIGLALAQQIARGHGGEISLVNRQDGEGARAIVRLPLTSVTNEMSQPVATRG